MPYISQEDRRKLGFRASMTDGELNFTITRIIDAYLATTKLAYGKLNASVAALEGAKADIDSEFYVGKHRSELRKQIYKVATDYIEMFGEQQREYVVGVIECAKLELYRRIVAPYEDKKIAENGDVYTVKP